MRKGWFTVVLLSLTCFSVSVQAQQYAEKYRLVANKVFKPLQLDGKLLEDVWQSAQAAQDFVQNFPQDSIAARAQTRIMISFDEQNLYIGGVCYEATDEEDIVASLRRDFIWRLNENISIYIDPYNDYTNGFTFGLTPFGVQREGLVIEGGEVRPDWDNKWFSAVERYKDRWEFEMAIPFKTLRYDDQNDQWNIVFLRNNLKLNERSGWTVVPQGFGPSDFVFAGRLTFDAPLPKAGTNVVLIPFITSGVSKDFEEDTSTKSTFDAGFDAKVGVTSSLNLDLTVNPDFSQVEVDRQVTNLQRFEIFFPERRQFFLENQDLFGQGGLRNTRPFFSRRVGIAKDTADNALQVPILYGARLSGKIGQKWRVGLLNMQTRKENGALLTGVDEIANSYRLLAQNYTVGVLQRQVFDRSNVGVIAVNRQALNYDDGDSTISTTKYNRVLGVDYNLISPDGRWTGDFYFHNSFDEEKKDDTFSGGGLLSYQSTRFESTILAYAVGEDYNAEAGFVQRKNVFRVTNFNGYSFYPVGSNINNHGPYVEFTLFTDLDFEKTDSEYELGYQFQFNNTANLELSYNEIFRKLLDDFEPLDDYVLVNRTSYSWRSLELEFNTDRRKLFWASGEMRFGGFFNGNRVNVSGGMNYRYQPYLNVALDAEFNSLDLPGEFGQADFWLISPRVDLTFTDKLFLTTFVQYNEQADNVNMNARFQWRYRPVSDLFIVYTDNYFPESFSAKSRAIVFKLTSWLNL
ncbi:DUF5916 domain-containing protein [Fulvivirga sp. M361]|uniref:DUF5916 domain-containing protein n=1 Tax=Fulvivirga sp. M361 TaxID=2594266 RepID=UPI0016248523|nr:DUF5916 domain-containing protein [Fulvivirga sp. M361]